MSWMDDIKVAFASVTGLGNWLIEMDLMLKAFISLASLLYIILKIKHLLEKRK